MQKFGGVCAAPGVDLKNKADAMTKAMNTRATASWRIRDREPMPQIDATLFIMPSSQVTDDGHYYHEHDDEDPEYLEHRLSSAVSGRFVQERHKEQE